MAGILDYYGYRDEQTKLVTIKSLDEQRQAEIDADQYRRIQKNLDDNTEQQGEINLNTLVNDAQQVQIDDLEDKIEHISGGTVTDLDMGDWG